MNRSKQSWWLALLTLFPLSSRADVGSLGGVVMPALIVALVVWICLTLLVFVLSRRLTIFKRIAATVLFLIAPVLICAIIAFKWYAFGDFATDATEVTRESVSVGGAVFPAGSQAHYKQQGGFFGWRAERTLLDVQSSSAVPLGDLYIYRLAIDGDHLQVAMIRGQTLDGWPCASGPYTLVERTPAGYVLEACWLESPREWNGQTVPAGTYVARVGEHEWAFSPTPKPSD